MTYFVFLKILLLGHLLGCKVLIFQMSDLLANFYSNEYFEFLAINSHKVVNVCSPNALFLD